MNKPVTARFSSQISQISIDSDVSEYKLGLIDSNYGTGLTRSSIYRWLDGSFPEWSAWPGNRLEADTGEDCVYVEGAAK